MKLSEIDYVPNQIVVRSIIKGRLAGKVSNGVKIEELIDRNTYDIRYTFTFPMTDKIKIRGVLIFSYSVDLVTISGETEIVHIPQNWSVVDIEGCINGKCPEIPYVTAYNGTMNFNPLNRTLEGVPATHDTNVIKRIDDFTKMIQDHFSDPMVINWFQQFLQ